MLDNLFYLAVGAFGWGLSLATYRMFALRNSWPMGALHADTPAVPVVIGVCSLLVGLLFAAFRGADFGGWIIIGCGLLLFLFWTGFLRVGSQISLFLAPAFAVLLLIGWLAVPFGFDRAEWATQTPSELIQGDQDEQ